MSDDVFLWADTERSAALRHEIPVAVGDPFGYAEVGGRAFVFASSLDLDRIQAARPDVEAIEWADVGFYELLESGRTREDVVLELIARAATRMGLKDARVDPEFPLAVADRLRADGIALTPDHETFSARRRAKSRAELAGIRRAQRAADAGMGAAAALLRRASIDAEGQLVLDGDLLTAEDVRGAIREACDAAGAPAPADIVVASVRQGFGHEPGSGPLPANLPIQIDLWPRDEASGCWADMTRTFVVGEPDEATRAQEVLVRDAFFRTRDAVRPGVTGRALHAISCDVFEAAGIKTQRTGPDPEHPNDGYQFSLGHGVGLEVHEDPSLGLSGHAPLVTGDVIAIEPGIWANDIGGVRFEDLLLVTADGSETLTDFPYDLKP